MKYVYILQSTANPDRYHVGLTNDLRQRLSKHNACTVPHTSKFAHWTLKTYLAFDSDAKAALFEQYLKSASGRAFAKKRL